MASPAPLAFQAEGEEGRGKPCLAPWAMPTVVQEAPFLQSVKNQGEVRQVPDQTAGSSLNYSL